MKAPNYPKILLVIFLLTLPLVNPWVRGDGVGYYAYVRSLLVQHNLRFETDWLHSNWPFVPQSINVDGRIDFPYTPTGHLPNHFAIGSSILWAPFLVPVHLVMKGLAASNIHVKPDGFSPPYILTMALATALYGFVGLWISFEVASSYVREKWAFLATVGIWFATSLPVYLYFNPSYSHAHSVFAVAVFLWYWRRTRSQRTMGQWAILGVISGLMLDVYYINIAMLVLPLLESMRGYSRAWRSPGHDWESLRRLFLANLIYSGVTVAAFLPTLITRKIIYGNPLEFGYDPSSWAHPALWQPLLSSNHGMLSWTPILIPSLIGLFLLRRSDRELSAYSVAAFVAMYCIVASHSEWHGISSFGNRFFISFSPLFIMGLAVFFEEASRWFPRQRVAFVSSALVVGALMLWNLAFIYQWGVGLVPHVGPISWRQMVHNQFLVVPERLGGSLKSYFTERRVMMHEIDNTDLERVRGASAPSHD